MRFDLDMVGTRTSGTNILQDRKEEHGTSQNEVEKNMHVMFTCLNDIVA